MDNHQNMGYEGTFWFGNPPQEMKILFDTGSGWAWMFSDKCGKDGCPAKNKKYDSSKSSSFKSNEQAGQFLQYGKGAIAGHPAQDRACFSKDATSCVENLTFLTVVKAKDVESLQGSGLIGLSPSPATQAELNEPFTNGIPSFISQLKNSAKFNADFESIFSIYLSNDPKVKGKVTFGGFDLKNFAKKGSTESDVYWIDQSPNENYWATNSKGVSLGETVLTDKYQFTILDNGMSYAMAPQKDFVQMLKTLNDTYGVVCESTAPSWTCVIPDEKHYLALPELKFKMVKNQEGETKEFVMPRHSYLKIMPNKSATNPKTGKKLIVGKLLFSPWEFQGLGGNAGEEYWVLGAQFLHNYYTMYDFKEKKIGLVESVSSSIGAKYDLSDILPKP